MEITELLQALNEPEPRIRYEAIYQASKIGGEVIWSQIARMAQTDPDVFVRTEAVHKMSFTFGDPDLLVPLLEIYESPDETAVVRAQAAEGIGNHLGCADQRRRLFQRATRLLITGLSDSSAGVRFWSAFALGAMRTRKALPALRELLSDTTPCIGWWPVCDEAADAIASIERRAQDIPEREMEWVSLSDGSVWCGFAPENVPPWRLKGLSQDTAL